MDGRCKVDSARERADVEQIGVKTDEQSALNSDTYDVPYPCLLIQASCWSILGSFRLPAASPFPPTTDQTNRLLGCCRVHNLRLVVLYDARVITSS